MTDKSSNLAALSSAAITAEDEATMSAVLAEARKAYGRTSPNPMVGSLIVKDGVVVASGHHRRAGLEHAEVAAIKDAESRGVDLRGTTLYVNLEPCSFQGRTPPCTEVCVRAGFARVIVGTLDPNPKVNGRGIAALEAAGIEVTHGVLKDECRALNAPFFTRMLEHRPHVTVKVAMSLDGKIATRTGESFPLTGPEARQRVHVLRDRVDAILIGRRTAELDDPRLTCRLPKSLAGPGGPKDPIRIVLDSDLSLPTTLAVFNLASQGRSEAATILVAADDTSAGSEHLTRLDELGVEVVRSPRLAGSGLDLAHLLGQLAERDVSSLLVEGGGATLGSFMDAGLVDVWIAHVAPVLVGGADAPSALGGGGVERLVDRHQLGDLQVHRLGHDVELVASVQGYVYGLD